MKRCYFGVSSACLVEQVADELRTKNTSLLAQLNAAAATAAAVAFAAAEDAEAEAASSPRKDESLVPASPRRRVRPLMSAEEKVGQDRAGPKTRVKTFTPTLDRSTENRRARGQTRFCHVLAVRTSIVVTLFTRKNGLGDGKVPLERVRKVARGVTPAWPSSYLL